MSSTASAATRGWSNLDLGDGETEFLHLEYADKAKLYVPVAQLHLICRYTGAAPERRRCTSWAPASGKRPSARPPSRCATPPPNCSTSTPGAPPARAIAFAFKPHDYEAFADGFGFEETADQAPPSTP